MVFLGTDFCVYLVSVFTSSKHSRESNFLAKMWNKNRNNKAEISEITKQCDAITLAKHEREQQKQQQAMNIAYVNLTKINKRIFHKDRRAHTLEKWLKPQSSCNYSFSVQFAISSNVGFDVGWSDFDDNGTRKSSPIPLYFFKTGYIFFLFIVLLHFITMNVEIYIKKKCCRWFF